MPKYMPKSGAMENSKTKEGTLGLSYPMLNKGNYTTWALKMKVYMQAHGVWGAVENDDPKVVIEERTDKIALAAIYQGIPEEILLSVAEKKTAKETWEAVKTMCLGADRVKTARIQTLKAEFEALSMKEAEPLDEFCLKLNGLVTNMRALGGEIKEAYVVKKLLRAVPSKFLQIASTIEQFGDLEKMSIEETIGSLKAHEERLRGKVEPSGGQLLLTEEEWSKREKDEGKLLLTREEWLKRTSKGSNDAAKPRNSRDTGRGWRDKYDKSKVKCFGCQGYGHYAAECKKSKREKEHKEEVNIAQMQDDEPALLLTEKPEEDSTVMLINEEKVLPKLSQNSEGDQVSSNLWYLDNGASNHMTGQLSKFRDLDRSVNGQVRFGDGSTVLIKGKGSIVLKCKNGDERLLKDVYYIPTLCNNIISLGQLSEDGNKVILNGAHLWVYGKDGQLIMKVTRSMNRLYKIIIESGSSECLLSKCDENAWLWHTRLGHVNFNAMNLMSTKQMVYGLPDIKVQSEVCNGCLMSKQTRKGFPSQATYSANRVLEIVHGDLCGPISPATTAGNKYLFLLVDDYSRVMWGYLLKNKDESFEAFKRFRAQVENGKNRKVGIFRTDRGGEFTSKQFISYCEEAGITRQFTAPYSPQQNGVVERRNRTVIEMARSFLKEKQLPLTLWGEAVRHSLYVLNRLPTRAVTGVTPYEAWSKCKPNIGHIRVFGCLAHMKLPIVHTTKLSDRSKLVINLGKEPGTKAYRLYDPEKKSVHVSRDVVFEEDKSWSWDSDKETEGEHCGTFTVFDTIAGETGGENVDMDESYNSGNEELQTDGSSSDGDTSVTPHTPQSSNPVHTPQSSHSSNSISTATETETDSESRRFRSLEDIYNETQGITLEDDELLFAGAEEPTRYEQAATEHNWRQAMKAEIEAVEKNNTWVLTELPPGQKTIGLKWVFKLKRDTNGKIIKHKARIVAKGYVQRQGKDFEEIFAPVARLETVRILLALAAKHGWEVHHLDVKSAFLNGEIQEEVYVTQPEGFVKEGKEHLVYKLVKALYGLRQAPRAWYTKLSKYLEKLGFVRCPYEHAVYTKKVGGEILIIGVYVDDLLVTGTKTSIIEEFKVQMSEKFEMSNLGILSYYLGLEVKQGTGKIELSQAAYAKKLLEKAGMWDCNPTKIPMDPKECIGKDEGGKLVDVTKFKSMIGGLRYLVHTRPDIAYAVGIVSRFMEKPTMMHQLTAKRILRYIKGTLSFGLIYTKGSGSDLLTGYSDSDLAGHVDDRRSTGGMVFYLNEGLVTWSSQKQRCVALSSCEAEFMAATAAACQAIWLRKMVGQITGNYIEPVVLYIDNRSAIDLAKNPVFHGRSKHIDIRYHFIRECVENGEIVVKHISTDLQRADVLTKALPAARFGKMRTLLGVKNLQTWV